MAFIRNYFVKTERKEVIYIFGNLRVELKRIMRSIVELITQVRTQTQSSMIRLLIRSSTVHLCIALPSSSTAVD